jgi:asparagine synthase (glutamine-hydrolysing)
MCGYIGQLSFDKLDDELLLHANENILCRGPDETIHQSGKSDIDFESSQQINYSLIFNRLSVIDLSQKASQPMYSEEFKSLILFNGEIYNHKILRQEMESEGVKFYSNHSDTEVVLNGLAVYGKDFINKLIGQFSITFIDFRKNKMFLIRDRLGQKPLFYYVNKSTIAFGSNLGSLKKIKGEASVNKKNLESYLNYGVIPSPNTIYSDIYKLKPGQIIEVEFHKNEIALTKTIYWDPKSFVGNKKFSEKKMMNLLENSIKIRMNADVNIANFLSGGIDSTTIIKIANKFKKINTFSMSMKKSNFNEIFYFEKVAYKYGTNHKTISLDTDTLSRKEIDQSILLFDEPYADPSTIPSFLLSKEVSKKYKVAISGDGGDEVFGGYKRTSLSLKEKSFFKNLFSKFYFIYPSFLGTGNKFLRHSRDTKEIYSSFLEDKKFMKLMKINYLSSFQEEYLNNTEDELKNLLLCDLKFYLPEMMLLKIDRTSMANSLEVRSPFVDHRLVEYMLSCKLNNNILENPKQQLKTFLNQDFSLDFTDRSKMGFVFDLEKWIYNNSDIVTETINSSEVLKNFNLNKVRMLFKYKSRINALRIWKLYFLAVYMNNK